MLTRPIIEFVALFPIAVYDSGTIFDVAILDVTDDDIRTRFLEVSGIFVLFFVIETLNFKDTHASMVSLKRSM